MRVLGERREGGEVMLDRRIPDLLAEQVRQRTHDDHGGVDALADHRSERALELVWLANVGDLEDDVELSRRRLELREADLRRDLSEHPHPREPGDHLLQQGQILGPELGTRVGRQTNDVATGVSQARHEPRADRIIREDHDDRYRRGRTSDRRDMDVRAGDDHVHMQPYQLGRQVRQPLHLAVRIPALEDDVASLDVAETAQLGDERVEQRRHRHGGGTQKKADPVKLRRRLRLGERSRDDEAARERANEPPPIHADPLAQELDARGGQLRPQSWRLARRAPSAMAANFSQATLEWVSLNRTPEAANPQSAPAMTFSRPTILANRTIRSAISSGCSTRLVVWLMTPGTRIMPSGGRTSSKT